MTRVRWDPFKNISALQERINRLFDDSFPDLRSGTDEVARCSWHPQVDIFESEKGVVVQVDLPGIKKEAITIEVKDDVLLIRGERIPEKPVEKERYFLKERPSGPFQRSFHLQENIDPAKIRAGFKDGVLEIVLPRPEVEKPRPVSVAID